MIDAARQATPAGASANFDVRDDNGASLESGKYGAVVCSSVIEFVPDPQALLQNLHRACRPGALLALSFSNRNSLFRAYAKYRSGPKLPHYAAQYNAWSASEAKDIINRAGFTVRSGPVYFEASAFDKRPWLKPMVSLPFIGILGFLTATRN